jgi:uncharacterized coiled-coil DUF342 family protein
MPNDIVELLRLFGSSAVEREAAYEIERLREQLRLANIDNFNTNAEIDRLTNERDHARRLVCRHTKKSYHTLNRTAELRGWDCFKESDETVRNADEFRETLTELQERVETLTAERDEARKIVCELNQLIHIGISSQASSSARIREWDCFKEEE